MKKLLLTTITFIFVFSSAFGQLKITDKKLKTEKVKAIITLMEETKYVETEDDCGSAFGAGAIGVFVPYLIKYGNNLIKKATSKKAKDYVFESEVLNPQIIDFSKLCNHNASIEIKNYFYKKGGTKKNELATYKLHFNKIDNILKINIGDINEKYTPVKIKKNYDFILSSFEISVTALINQPLESGSLIQKNVDLGTVTINAINSSFQIGMSDILNETQILLPSITEKSRKVYIEQLLVKVKVKQINPHGTTNNDLNDFLEKNSETNESLLNTLLLGKKD
tara:strand:- start:2633 stop:3472 length:840 start_codon:yes stop_codon:yes gene_type:complete